VGGYLGTIAFFLLFPDLVEFGAPVESIIYKFYLWAGVPLLVSTGLVLLFLRPVYLISACDIYADYVAGRQENLLLPPPPAGARGNGAVAAAAVFLLLLLAVMAFRDELGLTGLLGR
jgi:hypothetical protein